MAPSPVSRMTGSGAAAQVIRGVHVHVEGVPPLLGRARLRSGPATGRRRSGRACRARRGTAARPRRRSAPPRRRGPCRRRRSDIAAERFDLERVSRAASSSARPLIDDVAPLAGQVDGHGGADAARAAGHKRSFTVQIHRESSLEVG